MKVGDLVRISENCVLYYHGFSEKVGMVLYLSPHEHPIILLSRKLISVNPQNLVVLSESR